ncbi:MAG TPA: ABC transporter permease [Geminicoccus sp.]|jgi:spermidine/putrescine transport system permease protein|uniref:ABC transporter permease n=1 Tax=Geminicoccus sp. TaxID=2024832 RepID=UPI002E350039|nr:ABC transporter permease [Geminicoccus sp.]HEX2528864.1 ABC transporter permease [Geminicoccus sp.]
MIRTPGADGWMSRVLGFYLVLFFIYMFGPLVIMTLAAFNDSPYPTVTQWRGWTLHWFGVLFTNDEMWLAIQNSVVIGFGAMLLSVPCGLAAALMLTRMRLSRTSRNIIYGMLVSPVLAPGILLGISTLIFWQNFGVGGGPGLAMVAQTSFIAAYCMLLFMARLQRFDLTLEEAALDLGASHTQVFRRILLPFLRPVILTACVLAFLQSLENYNTTVFAIGGGRTMMIEIASNVRHGLSPMVNALAVVLIGCTIVLAFAYEVHRRVEHKRAGRRAITARAADEKLAHDPVLQPA